MDRSPAEPALRAIQEPLTGSDATLVTGYENDWGRVLTPWRRKGDAANESSESLVSIGGIDEQAVAERKGPEDEDSECNQRSSKSDLVPVSQSALCKRVKILFCQTYARVPHAILITRSNHPPIDTSAFDFNRSNPNDRTSVGAYDDMVLDGARPAMVKMTWGMSLQLVRTLVSSCRVTLGLTWILVGSSRITRLVRMWASRSLKARMPRTETGLLTESGKREMKMMPTTMVRIPSSWLSVSEWVAMGGVFGGGLTMKSHCHPARPAMPRI